MLTSCFDWFLIDSWSIFDRCLDLQNAIFIEKIVVFVVPEAHSAFLIWRQFMVRFLIDSGPYLPPFSSQNPSKSYKNQIPRVIEKLIDFCFDFWSILAPFWGSTWSHVGHQEAPKRPPIRPKRPPRRPPRGPQDALKTFKTPQEAPRGFQDTWTYNPKSKKKTSKIVQ